MPLKPPAADPQPPSHGPTPPAPPTHSPRPRRWYRRGLWLAAGLLLLVLAGLAVGEARGWPWLVAPLQAQLQQRLGRDVRLQPAANAAPAANAKADTAAPRAALHFWGGIRLQSPHLEVAAPTWSQAPYLLLAQDIDVRLRYGDLWRAWRGQQLRVRALQASALTAYLERDAYGRASWQLAQTGAAPAPPRVESMEIRAGVLHYQDIPLQLALEAKLALAGEPERRLQLTAKGQYRKNPFQLSLRSTGALPWEAEAGTSASAAVTLAATVGRASLDFQGVAADLLHLNGLAGDFTVQGPSLAAVGEPLGVTLPTTPAFRATGALQRAGPRWAMQVRSARVGDSQLGGQFVFDTAGRVPRLSGKLEGSLLKLADLGPAVGASGAATAPASSARVLPTRPFDLAALRAMDADVRIAIAQVDADTRLLEPLRPFNARLLLVGGVLSLSEIEARTGQGHLGGTLALNGRGSTAHWVAALNWDSVQLEHWVRQSRAKGLPPFIAGQLQGHATLQGNGRSTAEILGSLQGQIGAAVTQGRVSHLLLEAGGLDLAEALGVVLQGDQTLPLDCAVADLEVNQGVLRPRPLVLDTSDSTVWVDGSLSLSTETLDLRAVVAPKDFSPLTLRSPLHIGGSFAKPQLALDKKSLGLKLGSAVLLGLLNPLAAVLPLVDVGSNDAARQNSADCRARMQGKLQRGVAAAKSKPATQAPYAPRSAPKATP